MFFATTSHSMQTRPRMTSFPGGRGRQPPSWYSSTGCEWVGREPRSQMQASTTAAWCRSWPSSLPPVLRSPSRCLSVTVRTVWMVVTMHPARSVTVLPGSICTQLRSGSRRAASCSTDSSRACTSGSSSACAVQPPPTSSVASRRPLSRCSDSAATMPARATPSQFDRPRCDCAMCTCTPMRWLAGSWAISLAVCSSCSPWLGSTPNRDVTRAPGANRIPTTAARSAGRSPLHSCTTSCRSSTESANTAASGRPSSASSSASRRRAGCSSSPSAGAARCGSPYHLAGPVITISSGSNPARRAAASSAMEMHSARNPASAAAASTAWFGCVFTLRHGRQDGTPARVHTADSALRAPRRFMRTVASDRP
mmetsp:Transcript_26328/g.84734  ORF Transcript_26328/g.84734 Transcript_26328/m.84734 type:complete len:367 (+) Transcript_26328:210-1310(+)